MSGSISQPSSRAAKSGKFALLSRAIKHSDIHLEVLFLQNRKPFEYFFRFYQTLGISPKDLERFRADIAFMYTALACSLAISTNLNFDLIFATRNFISRNSFRYQMRVLIGQQESLLSRACIEKIFWDQKVNKQNFTLFVELIFRNI